MSIIILIGTNLISYITQDGKLKRPKLQIQ